MPFSLSNIINRIPTAVRHLIIINFLMFLTDFVLQMRGVYLAEFLGLYSLDSGHLQPWQPLTYMFLHGNFAHLFFNMYGLWLFGSVMERFWGMRRFLFYYFACGIGAGVLYMLLPSLHMNIGYMLGPFHITIGASGAIYGLLLAFAMYFPKDRLGVLIWMFVLMAVAIVLSGTALGGIINDVIFVIFILYLILDRNGQLSRNGQGIIFMESRLFVAIMILIELIVGFFIIDGVAHFAHLGGMLIGFLLILYWRKHPFSQF